MGVALPARSLPVARLLGWSVVAVGTLVLVGWQFDVAALISVLPGEVAMNPMTAVGFLLCGLALAFSGRRLGVLAAVAALLLGLGRLAEYIHLWNPGIDDWAFRPPVSRTPSQVAPFTSFDFVLIGSSLLLTHTASRRAQLAAQALSLAAALVALTAVTGFLFGVPELHGPMAIHTAGCFLLLAGGVLVLAPDLGVLALIRDPGPGGLLLRRLLPTLVVVSLCFGWLQLAGRRSGLYSEDQGAAIFSVGTVVVLAAIAFRAARLLEITEMRRRSGEEDRRRSEARFQALAASAPDAVVSADHEGRITFVNATAERLFGHPAEAMVGRSTTILMPERFHADHRRGLEHRAAAPDEAPAARSLELVGLRADGGEFPVELSVSSWLSEGSMAFTAIIRDATTRKAKEEELRRYAAELEAANAELDAFAYSVSHDLRAPLRSIDGFSQAVLEDYGELLDATGKDFLRRIRAAAQRMAELIDDLLALSRVTRAELRREVVDLSSLAEGKLRELQRRDGGRQVEFRVAPDLEAEGDRRLLRVMLGNLLENAWKYSRSRQPAVIELGREAVGGEDRFFVRDNGVGFDMKYAGKLFGPFQRLHDAREFEGTGIGLATVERIIHRHGGRIWAEAQVDHGATFYFQIRGS